MSDVREIRRTAAQETGYSAAVWVLLLNQFNSPQRVAEALWDGGDNIFVNGTPLLPGSDAQERISEPIRLYEPTFLVHNLHVVRSSEAALPQMDAIRASTITGQVADSLQDRLARQAEHLLAQEQKAAEQVVDGDSEMREGEPEPVFQLEQISDDLPERRTVRANTREVAAQINLPKDRFFIQPIHRRGPGAVVCEDGWARVTLTPVMAVPLRDSAAAGLARVESDHRIEPDLSDKAKHRESALSFILAGLGGLAAAAAHIQATAVAIDPLLIQIEVAGGAPVSPIMARTIDGFNRAQRAVVRLGVEKMSDVLVAALTQKILLEGNIRFNRRVLNRLPARLQQSVAVRLEEVRLLQELLRSTFSHLVLVQSLEAQRGEPIILSPRSMAAIGFGARHAFLGLDIQRGGVNRLSDISWDEVGDFIQSSGYFALQ